MLRLLPERRPPGLEVANSNVSLELLWHVSATVEVHAELEPALTHHRIDVESSCKHSQISDGARAGLRTARSPLPRRLLSDPGSARPAPRAATQEDSARTRTLSQLSRPLPCGATHASTSQTAKEGSWATDEVESVHEANDATNHPMESHVDDGLEYPAQHFEEREFGGDERTLLNRPTSWK